MKTYYFYTIHEFIPLERDKFDYYSEVKNALEKRNGLLLELVNDVQDSIERSRKPYELDNGQDIRGLVYPNIVTQVSKESYDRIVEDEERILNRKSDKSKALMEKFNMIGWHKPFKIEASNIEDFNYKIKKLFDVLPKIDYSSTLSEGDECLYLEKVNYL